MKGGKRPRWKPAEVSFLRRQYGPLRLYQIAELLGRSAAAVRMKASEIGISKKRERHEAGHSQSNG